MQNLVIKPACFLGLLVVLNSITNLTHAISQESQTTSGDHKGLYFLEPETTVWEMGLEITGVGGAARGVIATFPLPVEWPEQKIKVLDQEQSSNVGRVTFKELDGAVKQAMIQVPNLRAGEVARVIVKIEVEKQWIGASDWPEEFRFAEAKSRELRKYLAPSPYIESRDRRIIKIADELRDEDLSAWKQVEKNYDWVRENVEYQFDQRIKSCLDALDDGVGDCEELSSLFIAICRAQKIPARAVWIPGHTYPEFYLEDSEGNGHWIPCQAAGGREFGAMSESKPILQKGDRFRIHGHRGAMRYVQPALTAADADGSPTMNWVMREVAQ